jgi:hypothetical protein
MRRFLHIRDRYIGKRHMGTEYWRMGRIGFRNIKIMGLLGEAGQDTRE